MPMTKEQQIVADFYEKIGNTTKGYLVDIIDGPLVHNFIVSPGDKTNLSTIKKAAIINNSMVFYGNKQINIQIPKEYRQMIFLDKILKTKEFKNTDNILPIVMGVDTFGKIMIEDLRKLPHALVVGRTGCGKSVFLNGILKSLSSTMSASECKFVIIDPTGVDYDMWESDKHLMCPIIKLEPNVAICKLCELTELMEERYQILRTNKAKNVEDYRKKTSKKDMPYIVVVIDELADLMCVARKKVEACIQRIAQKGRGVGIHLMIGTQIPNINVLTGVIRANMPTRIVFQLRTSADSMHMLGEYGAENLLPTADMLYSNAGRIPVRIHTAYVDCYSEKC